VAERIRGYALLAQSAPASRAGEIEAARRAYLAALDRVWPLDDAAGVVAGEIMVLVPSPPTPPRRAHRLVESRQDGLVRWRFDAIIAATALVAKMPLIHNNAADFEAISSAIERTPARFPGLGPLALLRCDSVA
jgi:predicted nucleic acid-binding protein